MPGILQIFNFSCHCYQQPMSKSHIACHCPAASLAKLPVKSNLSWEKVKTIRINLSCAFCNCLYVKHVAMYTLQMLHMKRIKLCIVSNWVCSTPRWWNHSSRMKLNPIVNNLVCVLGVHSQVVGWRRLTIVPYASTRSQLNEYWFKTFFPKNRTKLSSQLMSFLLAGYLL